MLVINGRHVCDATVANTRKLRRRGLIGRANFNGVLVIPHCRWIHTFGMKFTIDVAYLDSRGRVIKFQALAPNRIGSPVMRARTVVEAQNGHLRQLGVNSGQVIGIRHFDSNALSERLNLARSGLLRGQ